MQLAAKRHGLILIGGFVVLAALLALFLFSRVEVYRLSDPSGHYTVVASKRRYQNYLMRFPGDGGGVPGFVEIFGSDDQSFGRVPIPMIAMAQDIRWTATSAEIPAGAEWDFKGGTCYYWSDEVRMVWVKR